MTLMPTVIEPSLEFALETYEQAKTFQANLVWKKLDEITLEEALSNWLSQTPVGDSSKDFRTFFQQFPPIIPP